MEEINLEEEEEGIMEWKIAIKEEIRNIFTVHSKELKNPKRQIDKLIEENNRNSIIIKVPLQVTRVEGEDEEQCKKKSKRYKGKLSEGRILFSWK